MREVDIMLRLDHPGVVSCVPTPPGLDPGTEDLPTLCMEYCEEGDLRKELNKPESCRGVSESCVLAILNDITSALGYLHNRRIIHRDLKPENVVLKKSETRTVYKLIDLGYAKELGVSSMAQSFVGTLQYVAPELFLGHDYTKSVDYWSLGLLCHEVVTGTIMAGRITKTGRLFYFQVRGLSCPTCPLGSGLTTWRARSMMISPWCRVWTEK